MTDEELDKLVEIALLDLHTLNEWSIQTNPERVERPILAIQELKSENKQLEAEISLYDKALETAIPDAEERRALLLRVKEEVE